jgi:hypothetical protein
MDLRNIITLPDDEKAAIEASTIITLVECHAGSGKALLVSQILNADEETIERVMKELEK